MPESGLAKVPSVFGTQQQWETVCAKPNQSPDAAGVLVGVDLERSPARLVEGHRAAARHEHEQLVRNVPDGQTDSTAVQAEVFGSRNWD